MNHTSFFFYWRRARMASKSPSTNGSITIHDASLILRDQNDIVAVSKKQGRLRPQRLGVSRYEGDDEALDGFTVKGLEGVFESDAAALVAAVDAFGLRAEDIEEIDRRIAEAAI